MHITDPIADMLTRIRKKAREAHVGGEVLAFIW